MGRRPVIKVGDPVECHYQGDKVYQQWLWRLPEGIRGVVTFVNEDHYYSADIDYNVYWFSGKLLPHAADEVIKCHGARRAGDKEFCSQCEYKVLCPHMRKIVLCDISEFGEKKYNIDICKKRKCKRLVICATERFIQK